MGYKLTCLFIGGQVRLLAKSDERLQDLIPLELTGNLLEFFSQVCASFWCV